MLLTEKELRRVIRKTLIKETFVFNPWLLFWGSAKDHESLEKLLSSPEFTRHLFGLSLGLLGTGVAGAGLAYAASAADLAIAYQDYKNDPSLVGAIFVLLAIVPFADGILNRRTSGEVLSNALKKKGINNADDLKSAVKNSENSLKNIDNLNAGQKKALEHLNSKHKSSTGKDLIKKASKATSKVDNIVIPKYGQETTIGYHGTSKEYLKGMQKSGLDNRIGRAAGGGLDAQAQGVMKGTVSNWTYTPEKAIGFSEAYGDNAVLLRFDTQQVTSNKGLKTNKIYEEFFFFDNARSDGKTFYARPAAGNEAFFHKHSIGDSFVDQSGYANISDPGKIIEKMEFSVKPDFEDSHTVPGETLKTLFDSDVKNYDDFKLYPNHKKVFDVGHGKTIGVADKPIPPELISVSFDGGKTYKKLLDLDLK